MSHLSSSHRVKHRKMPVPIMLELLEMIRSETHDDIVLLGVSRTVSQAIDELAAVRRVAIEVMHEAAGEDAIVVDHMKVDRRRLC